MTSPRRRAPPRQQLAVLHLLPVALRIVDVGVDVAVAIDLQEAAGDGGRVALLGKNDFKIVSPAGDGRRGGLFRQGQVGFDAGRHVAVKQHFATVDARVVAGEAGARPQAAAEQRGRACKARVPVQHEARLHLLPGQGHHHMRALVVGRLRAEYLPGVSPVGGDLAGTGGRNILGKSGLANETPDQFDLV